MTNTTTTAKLSAIIAERDALLLGLEHHIAQGGTFESWQARNAAQEAAIDALTADEFDALMSAHYSSR